MSQNFDFSQKLELRDPAGQTLGYLLPAKETSIEVPQLQTQLTEAKEESRRLREELSRVCLERDDYLKALYAATRREITFAPEEIQQMEKNGGPLEPILDELERQAGCR